MWGWCIVTFTSARLKASVRFPPLRGMYQRGGTCKGCDIITQQEHSRRVLYKYIARDIEKNLCVTVTGPEVFITGSADIKVL